MTAVDEEILLLGAERRVDAIDALVTEQLEKLDGQMVKPIWPALIEGPIAPGQRLSFSRPFEDPPEGTTNVVPSVQ